MRREGHEASSRIGRSYDPVPIQDELEEGSHRRADPQISNRFHRLRCCSLVVSFPLLLYILIFVIWQPKLGNYRGTDDFRALSSFFGVQDLCFKPSDADASRIGLVSERGICEAPVRLGTLERGSADGGWNVCALRKMQQHHPGATWPPLGCVVYSFGSRGDFTFDIAAAMMGCEVHTFDPTMPTFRGSERELQLKREFNITFHDLGLGAEADGSACKGLSPSTICEPLPSIIKRLGHGSIEVVKIDVEGAEWGPLGEETTLQILKSHVRQLLVEYHLPWGVDEARGTAVLGRLSEMFAVWNWDVNFSNFNKAWVKWAGLHMPPFLEVSYVSRV
mmetsp:Transcript_84239/g.272320  ORF Transcript_84239/g.272320 Transcript_84239/m.272320 type:complete len:334 (-) Transcript_84239:137-1138(-)